MRIRPLLATLAAAAGVLTLFTAPAATASQSSAAVTCYGGAYNWDAGADNGIITKWIPGGDDLADTVFAGQRLYQASTRCNDINLRIDSYNGLPYVLAKVCFYPSSGGRFCNSEKRFNAGDHAWRVIATDVRDTTRFEVEFDDNGALFWGRIAH